MIKEEVLQIFFKSIEKKVQLDDLLRTNGVKTNLFNTNVSLQRNSNKIETPIWLRCISEVTGIAENELCEPIEFKTLNA